MKFNMRTLEQIINIGTKLFREWDRYNKKNRETQGNSHQAGQENRRQPRPQTGNPTYTNPYATGADDISSWEKGGYPGDYTGPLTFAYSPNPDGDADPGEIVWTWVPYEENYSQGKDRPVLIVGHDGPYLLALMLTSKDRNNSKASDPNYLDIGSGVWDKEGRDSEVKLDRVLRIKPRGIRREGAIMPKGTFDYIAKAYQQR